ncbi:glycosyltransferase family 2 protein [Vulcanococcus limneticus]|uniref:glycosyltransferase family 2 protein n=1 Tax=Vulcanococcus limneticus TaxID=2170428 RepID=UPI00398C0365
MTLLCRDEADIIASTLAFHLDRGVDEILVTDNASVDGTTALLEEAARCGRVRLLHQPEHSHDQGTWVTAMARLAALEHGADWVIHGDADEFWWPCSGDIRRQLSAVPSDVQALSVPRRNFVPPSADATQSGHAPFHQRQWLRECHSRNALGQPLPPKVCHRAHPEVVITDGNHEALLRGMPLATAPADGLEILHFPVRSYPQLERKVRQGAEALARNTRVGPEVGNTWRRLYSQLQNGTLGHYYDSLGPPDAASLQLQLEAGHLTCDRRLQKALAPHG